MFAVDFKLTDLLGVAGATVGIIIAGAILAGNFNAKYIQLLERYRGLTGEYRDNNRSDPRKKSLHEQIDCYRFRVRLLNVSALCMSGALLLFVATVGLASLSVILPNVEWLRWAGAATLFVGLVSIAVAVALDAVENAQSRRAIRMESTDFPDLNGQQDPERAVEHARR